jgi:hypothetical protein
MIHRRGLLIGALAMMSLPRLGTAATSGVEDFRLGVNWGGMHVADVALGFRANGAAIDGSMDITSRGMASLLTSYGGEIRATSRDRDGLLRSSHYQAHYSSRRYTRDIEIRYDDAGDPAEVLVFKRGEPQGVDIPRSMWAGTVDPLTGILRVRRWMVADDRPERLVVPIFDGRARYDIEANALAPAEGVARARLVVEPLASSSRSSWLEGWENEDGRWIEAKVSNDPRAVPLLIETQDGGTASSIELDKDCSNAASCS